MQHILFAGNTFYIQSTCMINLYKLETSRMITPGGFMRYKEYKSTVIWWTGFIGHVTPDPRRWVPLGLLPLKKTIFYTENIKEVPQKFHQHKSFHYFFGEKYIWSTFNWN